MNNNTEEKSFVTLSREIADNFIRDIVFIDEQAYPEKTNNTIEAAVHNNEFDAKSVSDAFLKKGKICAIYAPQTDEDINDCAVSLLKADAVVLDWNLRLKTSSEYDPMADDESDNRGHYTKPLIKKLVDEASTDKVKLIIVYTGETDLNEITDQIQKYINVTPGLIKEDCLLHTQTNNIRILVRAKETSQFEHIEQYKIKIVKYDELPNLIVDEFTKITMGLLPNYALSAITAIRDNTSNILGVFSKDIDPAFLGHYISVNDIIEAKGILDEILSCTIKELICEEQCDLQDLISKWIEYKFDNTKSVSIDSKTYDIDAAKLKQILSSDKERLSDKLSEINIQLGEDKAKKNACALFCTGDASLSNHKFAKLIQHKNPLVTNADSRKLTLGTIVKTQENGEEHFLLCIQQACDAARISLEKGRNFLFLPLKKELDFKGEHEAIIINENSHYLVDNKSYSINVRHFKPETDKSPILSKKLSSGEYVFIDTNMQQYVWIAELKDLLAQRIVDSYTSQLSRVGIDNSEWIRLIGKTK